MPARTPAAAARRKRTASDSGFPRLNISADDAGLNEEDAINAQPRRPKLRAGGDASERRECASICMHAVWQSCSGGTRRHLLVGDVS
eukprot:2486360-Pleurochrysis_carterae.AAC.3